MQPSNFKIADNFKKLGFELIESKYIQDRNNELNFDVKFRLLGDDSDFVFKDRFRTVIKNDKVAFDMFRIRHSVERAKDKKRCSL
jgi:hypothetical protein